MEIILKFLKIWILTRHYDLRLFFFRPCENTGAHFFGTNKIINSNIIFTRQTTVVFLVTYFISSTTCTLIFLTFHFTIKFLKSLWSDDSYYLNPLLPEELFHFIPYQFIVRVNNGSALDEPVEPRFHFIQDDKKKKKFMETYIKHILVIT